MKSAHCPWNLQRRDALPTGSALPAPSENQMTVLVSATTGLPRWLSGKVSACQCRSHRRCGFDLWVGKIPWSRKWEPTPVILAWEIAWTGEPGRL